MKKNPTDLARLTLLLSTEGGFGLQFRRFRCPAGEGSRPRTAAEPATAGRGLPVPVGPEKPRDRCSPAGPLRGGGRRADDRRRRSAWRCRSPPTETSGDGAEAAARQRDAAGTKSKDCGVGKENFLWGRLVVVVCGGFLHILARWRGSRWSSIRSGVPRSRSKCRFPEEVSGGFQSSAGDAAGAECVAEYEFASATSASEGAGRRGSGRRGSGEGG